MPPLTLRSSLRLHRGPAVASFAVIFMQPPRSESLKCLKHAIPNAEILSLILLVLVIADRLSTLQPITPPSCFSRASVVTI